MTKQLLLGFVIFAALIGAGNRVVNRGSAPTYLINQNFEGTGYDNGETWSESGTVDKDNTTNPIVGSQSLYLGAANFSSVTSPSFTGQTTVSLFFKLRPVASNGLSGVSTDFTLLAILNSSNEVLAGLSWNQDGGSGEGIIKLETNGTLSSASSQRITLDVVWNVWIDYVEGGTCVLAASTGTTKPTSDGSGNIYLTKTGGTGTATKVYLSNGGGSGGGRFDKVLVSASVIGDNP